MSEFWEDAFQEKQVMWGTESTAVAVEVADLFKQQGFKTVLIPGFGYGRNAMPFYELGFEVTGIEISETAIQLARELMGREIYVFHGSVDEMPFDAEVYDSIFCHALIHLLDSKQRKHLLQTCYNHLRQGGMMCFTSITKEAGTYGVGEKLGTDWYRSNHGVNLYFYDEASIKEEFGAFDLVEATKIEEGSQGKPITKFWKIVCHKQ